MKRFSLSPDGAGASTASREERKVAAPLVWVTVGLVLLLAAALVTDRLFRPDAFRFETISLRGKVNYIDTQGLLGDLKTALGGNYFSVDLDKIEAVMQSHPWVKDFSVRRKWPKTLQLWVEEYRPVAQWRSESTGEKPLWLTATGEVVELDAPAEELAALPRLSGDADQAAAIWETWQRWSQRLNRVGLALAALDYSPSQVWRAQVVSLVEAAPASVLSVDRGAFANDQLLDFQLKLLAENADQQLADFLDAVHGHFQQQLAEIQHVDLRYHHGFAVKWRQTENLSVKPL